VSLVAPPEGALCAASPTRTRHYAAWLDSQTVADEALRNIVDRRLVDQLDRHAASTLVNSESNEGPELIEAVGDCRLPTAGGCLTGVCSLGYASFVSV